MQSFVIVYNTSSVVQRLAVERVIKSFSVYAHILGEYWFVKGNITANQIYNKINPLVGPNGRVIVVAVTRNAAWNNITNSNYLYNNL